jgi:carbonic anhydrase
MINGNHYDMELHIVHKSADGKIAVTGLLFYMVGNDVSTPFDALNLAQNEK